MSRPLCPRAVGAVLLLCAGGAAAFQGSLPRILPGLRSGAAPVLRGGRRAAAASFAPTPSCRGRAGAAPWLRMSSAAPPQDFTVEPVEDKIPITLLSGFLGAGKTTLLREMLQNKGGLKVGVVVNDMAAINIDAKLVKSDSTRPAGEAGPVSDSVLGGGLLDTSDVLELQNGCACCSASEELLSSVMKLLLVSAEREEPYDRIIIEMSGVAEPKNIRKQFFDAAWGGHPALEYAELKNMVTVVDAANFLSAYQTADAVFDRPDLVEEESSLTSADRAIVDLLTEQVEVADYVLLNKADLLAAPKLDQLNAIITALNPDADVIRCSYGKVDLDIVLGQARDKWVANADDEDDFRVSVRAAKAASPPAEPSQGHSHGSPSPALGHTHDHAAATAACADEECSDPSHAHGHADGGRSHAHTHASAEAACSDPECTDAAHSHAETHAHAHAHSSIDLSPQDKFGITSFVYTRRRPFHPDRLKKLIAKLPVSAGQDERALEGWVIPEVDTAAELGKDNPLRNIIRSKGFVWVSTYHRVALYWSHAGQFFDLKDFGMFWAATPLKYWPRATAERAQVVADFGMGEKWGDRRQEIVFIGVGLRQDKIEAIVDEALLTDEEMEEYESGNKAVPDKVKMDWTTSPPIPVDIIQIEKS